MSDVRQEGTATATFWNKGGDAGAMRRSVDGDGVASATTRRELWVPVFDGDDRIGTRATTRGEDRDDGDDARRRREDRDKATPAAMEMS
ncbi:hypothetical protein PIB30_020939 [Stylosanthes scabra]|uniref:Uncharacterized protein n=1 Tax=Stylosanthes scabra TaxID=79078 RepID=A0ABU6Q8M3_9FABA|nr:hypothetical protein [Stylosanthes scabra]